MKTDSDIEYHRPPIPGPLTDKDLEARLERLRMCLAEIAPEMGEAYWIDYETRTLKKSSWVDEALTRKAAVLADATTVCDACHPHFYCRPDNHADDCDGYGWNR